MWTCHVIILLIYCTVINSQWMECFDDILFEPDLGLVTQTKFSFLGALQYIHVKTGRPHYFTVPRVVLVSRQFVITTAAVAAEIPQGYALGNVAFGDYERDEQECGFTLREIIAKGYRCSATLLLVPIADVLLHPEYKNFGVKNSLALLKLVTPIKSLYMLPVCLPTLNFMDEKHSNQIVQRFLHVDFIAAVPRDFADEEKEVSGVFIFPADVCRKYELVHQNDTWINNNMACTTGCDYNPGSPVVVHELTGHWSLLSISVGGAPCPDPLRPETKTTLPYHITIHPYVPWITMAITGVRANGNTKSDPFGYQMTRALRFKPKGRSALWVGHWWVAGLRCYDRGLASYDLFRFYHDTFTMRPRKQTFINYYVELTAHPTVSIACVKVCLPFRYTDPMVWDLYTDRIKIAVPLVSITEKYTFQIEAWGYTVPKMTLDDGDEE